MTKVHLLGANKSYDRSVQTVSVNQVVVLEGYSYDSYVVYEVTRDKWGITYHLVNLRTHEFHTSDLIRPLSEKFGIGIYYDDANPKFLDPLETAALLTKAKEKKAEEEKKAKEAKEEYVWECIILCWTGHIQTMLLSMREVLFLRICLR